MPLSGSRPLWYATLFATVLGTGLAHGLLTDRWAPPVAEDAAHLGRLTMAVGDWDGSNSAADPDRIPQIRDGEGLLRRYVNRKSGDVVTVYLSVGPAGPMVSGHMPESCYPGAGYRLAAPVGKHAFLEGSSSAPQDFRVANFNKTERAEPIHLRVFWAWSADGDWKVPDYPRLAFARQRRVFKLYVIRQAVRDDEPLASDPAARFLQVLVPELKKTFFTSGDSGARQGAAPAVPRGLPTRLIGGIEP
jgi:Protein of unknown function (DUF3485)